MHRAASRPDGKLHSIRAVDVCRYRLFEFPRPCFVTIDAVEQRSRRANLDAVAALRAVQPSAVCSDDGADPGIAGLDGVFVHPLVADTRAAFAKNAPLRVVGDYRRKIFFGLSVLLFGKPLLDIAPVEYYFLQFTLAAAVANRAIERVICKQELAHRPLRLFDLLALRRDDHSVLTRDRA